MDKNQVFEYPLSSFDVGKLQHIDNTKNLVSGVYHQQTVFGIHANAATEFYLRKQRFEDKLWVKDY